MNITKSKITIVGMSMALLWSVLLTTIATADINAKVEQLDIGTSTLDDIIRIFGEPEKYLWSRKTFTKDNLPEVYIAQYPNDFSVVMIAGYVDELRFQSPAAGYIFQNKIRVGSLLNKVLDVIGQPTETIVGEALPGIAEDGVLYKDINGEKGYCYYAREDKGARFFFFNYKVTSLYVTQAGSRTGGAGSSQSVKPIQSVNEFDNVCSKDLSKLDLSARRGLIDTLEFNQQTVWPELTKMPAGCNPDKIMTDAMNPGLGVRQLHRQGITGKGVNVAIIDQPLYLDHPEFAGKIVAYHDTGCGPSKNSMHGPAVASLLVGTNCGTAPDARVYYTAAPSWTRDTAYQAKALDWIIEQNKNLPASGKIRVVSVSAAPSGPGSPFNKNNKMWDRARRRAEAAGILVLDCTRHRGFISPCWYNPQFPDNVTQCSPGYPGMPNRYRPENILVPASPRTIAEEYDKGDCSYQYNGRGGLSWAIPYCAGVLAMGWQIRPDLPPEQMKELLFESAYTKKDGAKIINPKKFIRLVRTAKAAPRQNQRQKNLRGHSETNKIVPRISVGEYKLGMSKDDVLKSLRKTKGDSYRQEGDLIMVDGLALSIIDDSVKGITVLSPLYKFANGLTVGDSEQEFKRAFGLQFKFEEDQGKLYLTYKDEGLQFIIHKENRRVMKINVYQTRGAHIESDTPYNGKVIIQGKQPPGPITFPKIDRKPRPDVGEPREMKSLPRYNPNSTNSFQVDLRCKDLSKLNLSNSIGNLLYATFDDKTVWPASNQMPSGFDWQKIMELGKNPGLGVRSLHKKGITGRGVGIAILDQPLLVDHQEYADRLRLYEEIHIQPRMEPQMHGPAVASIAVGKTVGVAPEAELYYIAQWNFDWEKGRTPTLRYLAQGIHRVLEINKQLPKDKKIRVISISKGWTPSHKDYREITRAVRKAKAKGMLVVCTSVEEIHDGFDFGGLDRSPLADPDAFESYEPGLFLARAFWAGRLPPTDGCFWVPMDSRTTASPSGSDEYVFYRQGGFSWAVPYIAGVYALAVQVDPNITPEIFWSLAMKTGRTIKLGRRGKKSSFGPILDPVKLITALQNTIGK